MNPNLDSDWVWNHNTSIVVTDPDPESELSEVLKSLNPTPESETGPESQNHIMYMYVCARKFLPLLPRLSALFLLIVISFLRLAPVQEVRPDMTVVCM